jgi:hypothetical protein
MKQRQDSDAVLEEQADRAHVKWTLEFELHSWFENFVRKYGREPKPRAIDRAAKRIVSKLTSDELQRS